MKLYIWDTLSEVEKLKVLARPVLSSAADMLEKTNQIINQVRSTGDAALISLTEQYDRVYLDKLQVSTEEMTQAFNKVSSKNRNALEFAINRIEMNHQYQLPKALMTKTCEGVFCERQARPIQRVGLYIPGGTAPLVSTVLMLAVPAKIANCGLRILCTPPNQKGEIDPNILVAAQLCGIEKIFKLGGAQAIAAMAYGTESISKVDKIFGPGNAWVTQAKVLIAQDPMGASIDMPAGPSEVMVIADNYANADYVAADLLSQAEHGRDSQVMLVTFSEQFAKQVDQSIKFQLKQLPRKNIASEALLNSRFIIANDMDQAVSISNMYAPEHLILQVNSPETYIPQIQNAGAVFLGQWTPETVGDYVTGSNHVLPTFGYARSYSGLSVMDFMKFISFQTVTREGLKIIGPYAERLAEIEGLQGHKRAVTLRLEEERVLNE